MTDVNGDCFRNANSSLPDCEPERERGVPPAAGVEDVDVHDAAEGLQEKPDQVEREEGEEEEPMDGVEHLAAGEHGPQPPERERGEAREETHRRLHLLTLFRRTNVVREDSIKLLSSLHSSLIVLPLASAE